MRSVFPFSGPPGTAGSVSEKMMNSQTTIIEMIANYADHLLSREARPGKSTPILSGQMNDEELEGRIQRLWVSLQKLSEGLSVVSELSAAHLSTSYDTHTVLLLAPEEIRALFEDELPVQDPRNDVEIVATLLELHRDSVNAASEARAILAGRFDVARPRGRPPQQRGRELAIRLIGFSEGLGLKPTRNRFPNGMPFSAIDALLAALPEISSQRRGDPVADAIIREIPNTFDAIEKLVTSSQKNGRLRKARQTGKEAGARRLRNAGH